MSWILPAARHKPSTLGVHDGRLSRCPSSPNCASSYSPLESNRIEPLKYTGSKIAALERLLKVLRQDSRANIITQTSDYIHVEYTAFIFIDDVEFYFPPSESVIHIRSASRVGHSDMGANKRRAKAITSAFYLQE